MPEPAQPTVALVERLLGHPDIARHIAGLSRLRVAVTPEAGAVSGRGHAGGTELEVTGPVDAKTAEEAFHVTRVIPREDASLRLTFSYPPADLSGDAVQDADGTLREVEVRKA